jgi:hypothetical protein
VRGPPAPVAIVHQYAQVLADHRQRHTDLEHPAVTAPLPYALDAGFLHRGFAAIFQRFDAPCVDCAGAGAAEEQRCCPPRLSSKASHTRSPRLAESSG